MSLQDRIYQLYLLDQQVRGLSSRLDAAKRRLRAQANRLDQLGQQHHELEQQVKQASAHAATLEHESNDSENRIKQLRERMNTVTSNKEYSALLVEVNTLKVEKGKKEEEALAQMEQRDRLAAELAALEQKLEEQKKLVAGADAEVRERQDEVGERLAAATAERDAAQEDVPADALTIFDRAADAHDGEALGEVVEESRRHMEYSCGGCYMSIPVERLNTLMTRPDDVVCCPNCNRILHLGEALKTSITAK